MNRRWRVAALLAPGIGFLAILFAGPLLLGLAGSFGVGQDSADFTLTHYREILSRPSLRVALVFSLYYGLAPVCVSLVMAMGLAWVLRRSFWGRALFDGLYKIPMAVPGIIAALIVMTLAERGGFLDRFAAPLGLVLPKMLRDPWGVGVILTLVWKQLPFMTLVITGAFSAVPQDLVLAARTLGAGRLQAFWTIELPLALPGISAAVLLSFIGSMGSYAIPDLVGPASPRPLSVHMVAEFGSGHLPLVYAMGCVLSVLAVAVLLGYDALSRRAAHLLGAPRTQAQQVPHG